MIFISILLFKGLPFIYISSNLYIKISSIILLYSGLLTFNVINIISIGSSIGIFELILLTNLRLFHLLKSYIELIKTRRAEYSYQLFFVNFFGYKVCSANRDNIHFVFNEFSDDFRFSLIRIFYETLPLDSGINVINMHPNFLGMAIDLYSLEIVTRHPLIKLSFVIT